MYTMHSLETIIIVARTSDRTGTLGVSTFGLTYQHTNIHHIITIVIRCHLRHITIFFYGGEDVVTTLPVIVA